MTAVNLPDMVQMVREHGLIPVPLDIDPRTMAPFSTSDFKKLITPKVIPFYDLFYTDESLFGCLHLRS